MRMYDVTIVLGEQLRVKDLPCMESNTSVVLPILTMPESNTSVVLPILTPESNSSVKLPT